MKINVISLLISATIIMSCNENNQQIEQLTQKNDSLQNIITERDAALDEMIGTINLVENGFRAINEAQGRINLDEASNEKSRKEQIQDNIAQINETLEKNKAEIKRLNELLRNNNIESKQLKTMIENLQAQLLQKDKEISELYKALSERDIHIDELDKKVTELTQIKSDNEVTIQQQESEINSVWYAIGTKKELKNEKILKDGDVLRATDANMDYFRKADMRDLKTINTYSRSAKLLTSHPEGSYKLERDANKMYILTITDAQSFWSVSRYLVIQVK